MNKILLKISVSCRPKEIFKNTFFAEYLGKAV